MLAVTGLFRGLSGTIAFFCAVLIALLAGTLGWRFTAETFSNDAWRGLAVGVGALLAFGLVRTVVKKSIHMLLAQPSDALFGMLVGAVMGCLPVAALATSGQFLEYSNLATFVAGLLGQGGVTP